MSKLFTILTAAVVALTPSGFATAAERDQNSQQTQDRQRAEPAAGGATVSQHDQDYLVALKKCEPLTGADKSKCVDAAKKNNGQM